MAEQSRNQRSHVRALQQETKPLAPAEGAVATPTAGLRFTQALLDTLAERSIGWTMLTPHVGPGTFPAGRGRSASMLSILIRRAR
jgi:S-adenosylmethionine:tRNA-ribosyltransferase-isomerase (queuine synthetase)